MTRGERDKMRLQESIKAKGEEKLNDSKRNNFKTGELNKIISWVSPSMDGRAIVTRAPLYTCW